MKRILFFGIFILIGVLGYSQTWTEMVKGIYDIEIEFTVISKDQYDRIYNQNVSQGRYAIVGFHDVLEDPGGTGTNGKVIRGTKPKFKGYYYLISKSTANDPNLQFQFYMSGLGTAIIYGNSNTGSLTIVFGNQSSGYYYLGSNEFINLYNQCIRFVNGK